MRSRLQHQREALDRFAGVDPGPVRAARERVREIDVLLSALGGDERSRSREMDLLRFQTEEIAAARIESPDEDEDLAAEEEMLADRAAAAEATAAAAAAASGSVAEQGDADAAPEADSE